MTAERCPGTFSSPASCDTDKSLSISGPSVSQPAHRASTGHTMGDEYDDCNTNHEHQNLHTSILRISDQHGHGDMGKKCRGKALLALSQARPNTKETDNSKRTDSFSGCLTRRTRERLSLPLLPPIAHTTTCTAGTSNGALSEFSQGVADEECGPHPANSELSIAAPDADLSSDHGPGEQDVNTNARRRGRPKASQGGEEKNPVPRRALASPLQPSVVKALNLKPVKLNLTQSRTGLVVTYRPWIPTYAVSRRKCQNQSRSKSFTGRLTRLSGKQYRDSATSPLSLSPVPDRKTRSRSPLTQKRRSSEPEVCKCKTKSHSNMIRRSEIPHYRESNSPPCRNTPTPGPSWAPDELTRSRSESPESPPRRGRSPTHEKNRLQPYGESRSKRGRYSSDGSAKPVRRNRSASRHRDLNCIAMDKAAAFGRRSPTNTKASSAYREERVPSPHPMSSETAVKEVYSLSASNSPDRQCDKRRSCSGSPRSHSFASGGFALSQDEECSPPEGPRELSRQKMARGRGRSPRQSPSDAKEVPSRWRPPDKDSTAYLPHRTRSGSSFTGPTASYSFSEDSLTHRDDPHDSARNRPASPRERRRHHHHHRRHRHDVKERDSTGNRMCRIM